MVIVIHEKLGVRSPFDKLWKKLLILSELKKHMAFSRAMLCRYTSMSGPAIECSLMELVESDLVDEGDYQSYGKSKKRDGYTYQLTPLGIEALETWASFIEKLGVM